MDKKNQIFVSYSSKDMELVEDVLKQVSDLGVKIWKAPECISPGTNYAREIPRAIRESCLFLLMLSAHSQESIWVEKEVDTAVSARVQVIPLQLDDAPMSEMYRFYLNTVQMISYRGNPQRALEELRAQILSAVGAAGGKSEESREAKEAAGIAPASANGSTAGNGQIASPTNGSAAGNGQTASLANRSAAGNGQTASPANSSTAGSGQTTSLANSIAAGNLQKLPWPKITDRQRKANELRKNRIPLSCTACGCTLLRQRTLGVYVCEACGQDNFDEYSKIRNYLTKTGSATMHEISQETGVSRDRVKAYLEDQQDLDGRKYSRTCRKCGSLISSGTYCKSCGEANGQPEDGEDRFYTARIRKKK